jgi:DNA-binding IclR family transcriptional regulator
MVETPESVIRDSSGWYYKDIALHQSGCRSHWGSLLVIPQDFVQRTPVPAGNDVVSERQKKDSEKSSIQVFDRMMSLLDALAENPEPVSLKILSQMTKLHPSTTHRILAALTVSGMVMRDDNGAYGLGIRLLELGNLVKSRISIREVALPFMQKLHEELGESVNLGVRHEDEIVYVERTSSGRSLVRVVYLVGGRAPLHLTSLGKLFLADDSAEAIAAYVKRTGLPGKTLHSLVTLPALEKEIKQIRLLNIAMDNEEAEMGLRCIAAPVRDDSGKLVAGLSVSAPTDRHKPEWQSMISATASSISKALGFRPKASKSY